MRPDLDNVRVFVRRLVRRERRLVALRVGLYAALVGAAWIACLAWATWAGWSRSTTAAVLMLVGGLGTWAGVVVPLVRRWPRAGDAVRQARLVEALDPELRGRLVTVVEHGDGPRGGESEALLALVARRAASRVEAVPPARVHPATPLGRLASIATLAGAAALVLVLLVPGGPLSVFSYWRGAGRADAAVDLTSVGTDAAAAHIGDIVLRYIYPDYTGLDPVEVPNSTGDAHGPPGTVVEVRARSASPVAAAALVAYDGPALEAEVVDARQVSGRFTIQATEGTWHLVLDTGGEPATTREYAITPEADLPPDVVVDGDDVIELALDGLAELPWTARDDFGVSRVVLEVDQAEKRVLRAPMDRVATVSGRAVIRPADLGLRAGDVVNLTVAAWDNDAFAGAKIGRSRPIRLVVLGEAARDRRRDQRTAALIEAMLTVLADHLEDPWPAGDTSGELAAWGERLSSRYAAIEAVIDEYWDDVPEWAMDRPLVEAVVETARDLIRYTQVSFEPGSAETPSDAAFTTTADLRDDAIAALEDAVLFLDRMRREEALGKVARQTEDAARLAEMLSDLLESEDVDPLAIASQLDLLERMLQQLMEQAARLDRGPLREFVNQRSQELQSLLELAREALANGDMEEARELLERIARDLQQMAEGVQDELDRRGQQDDQMMREAADLDAELARLQAEQQALQSEVQAIRESDGERQRERSDALWQELDAITERLEQAASGYSEGLEGAERGFNERERASQLEDAARQLRQATQARDLDGAQREVYRARGDLAGSQRALEREQRMRGGEVPGPGQTEIRQMQRDLARAEQLIEQLREADQTWDPRVAERLSELEGRQEELREQLESARGQAEDLMQRMPMQPRGMGEALEEAGEQMERAGRSLQRGEAMGAEGSQGAAAQRIAEAREALQQAMRQASAGGQARRRGQGRPEGQGGGQGSGQEEEGEDGQGQEADGTGNDLARQPIEIPTPEDFQSPEEYRRALLEGMEGDVPEEYRALKRRYYEELVQQ